MVICKKDFSTKINVLKHLALFLQKVIIRPKFITNNLAKASADQLAPFLHVGDF